MISIKKLSKRYGSLQVLDQIDLEYSGGQSVALIGPNGSGKTTLIKSLLGLVVPEEGEIKVQGQDVGKSPNYREQIGYMAQLSRFPEQMKVGQLFALIKSLRKGCAPVEPDTWLYDSFKIDQISHKALGALSGGMKQQVSASLAFYFQPHIIILDEPTAGLDPVSNEILKEKINERTSQNRLIIVTSHILSDLAEISNHVTYLQSGKVYFDDSLDKLAFQTNEEKLSKMVVKLMKPEME